MLLVFLGLSYPVWDHLRKQGEKATCSNNMRSISQAILLYAEANNEGFPVAYYPDQMGNPVLQDGLPITWAALVQDGVNVRASFRCPSAKPEEVTRVIGLKADRPIELTYGMFAAVSGRTARTFDQPGATVLLAETSNAGALNTYNPLPFEGPDGQPMKNDGFLVGFDETNAQGLGLKFELDRIRADVQRNEGDPSKQGLRLPRAVTRLAFADTKSGRFLDTGPTRHAPGIHVIYLDGSLGLLRPPSASVDVDSASNARHRWAVP